MSGKPRRQQQPQQRLVETSEGLIRQTRRYDTERWRNVEESGDNWKRRLRKLGDSRFHNNNTSVIPESSRAKSTRTISQNQTITHTSYHVASVGHLGHHHYNNNNVTRQTQNIMDRSVNELETTFEGSNGNYGAMFDVSSPDGDHVLRIQSLYIHANVLKAECPVKVYGKPGTHVGFETNVGAWTLLVNTNVNCRGFGERTEIPQSEFVDEIRLSGGDTYAFFVILSTPDLRYTNGNELGAVYAETPYLQIKEGTGVAVEFQTYFDPRVWNGVVTYQLENMEGAIDDGCDTELTTTYTDNLGSFGNMFDIKIYDTIIQIYQIDFYTDLVGPVTYEIYTKSETYYPPEDLQLSDWELLERGTTNGLGNGRGTPVRNFVPFNVMPNTVQSFYVTLHTADIRYRNIAEDFPDTKEGDIYFQNKDMEILVGSSVGDYPMAGNYFGPRVWSGSIHYVADRVCDTNAPTFKPTTAPPTFAPTVENIEEPDFGDCTSTGSVATDLAGTTAAFGNMFTVRATDEPLTITSLEFHAGNAAGSLVQVKAYTKMGDYKGFETNPSAWKQIATAQVLSKGPGKPTAIPEISFERTHMYPGQTRAFYVTIDSPDIRYEQSNTGVGQPVAYTKYLKVNAGAGLAEQSFGSSIYEPRTFNGRVNYIHGVDCSSVSVLSSQVTYTFFIKHQASLALQEVIRLADGSVRSTVSGLLQSEPELKNWVKEYDLELDSTESFTADLPVTADSCGGALATGYTCTPLDTQVRLNHLESLSQGDVLYEFLTYNDDITTRLNSVEEFTAQYSGDIAVAGSVDITLEGEFCEEMNEDEQQYFEDVTIGYLNGQVSEVNVLGMEINGQRIDGCATGTGRLLQRLHRLLQKSGPSSSSITISTTVTGEYQPPPFIDFSQAVDDAIDADPVSYVNELVTGGEIELTDDGFKRSKPFFEKTQGVTAVATSTPAPTFVPASDSDGLSYMVIGAIVAVCFSGLFGFVWWWRQRGNSSEMKHASVVNMGGSPLDKRGIFNRKGSQDLFNRSQIIDAEVQYADVAYAQDHLPSALKKPKYGVQETYPQFNDKNVAPPVNQFPAGMGSTRSMLSKQSSGRSSGHSTRSGSSAGYPVPPEENGDVFQESALHASFGSLGSRARQEEAAMVRPMIRQSSARSMNGSVQSRQSGMNGSVRSRQSDSFVHPAHRSSRSLGMNASASSRGSAMVQELTEEEIMAAEAQQRLSARRLM